MLQQIFETLLVYESLNTGFKPLCAPKKIKDVQAASGKNHGKTRRRRGASGGCFCTTLCASNTR